MKVTKEMKKKGKTCGILVWISYSVAALPGFWVDDMTVWERTLVFAIFSIASYVIMYEKKENDQELERQRKSACRATDRR